MHKMSLPIAVLIFISWFEFDSRLPHACGKAFPTAEHLRFVHFVTKCMVKKTYIN